VKDVLDKLADDVKRSTIDFCIKTAEIHRIREIRPPDNLYQQGYNDAIRDVVEKLGRLK
jgi:hypothetical protein